MQDPIILQVFANTGHQYWEIPLKQLLPNKDLNFLTTFASGHLSEPWRQWGPEFPWIRYRYGLEKPTGERIPFISIAVETNLGIVSRGLLYTMFEPASKPEDFEVTVPYASEDEQRIIEEHGKARNVLLPYLPNKDGKDMPLDNLFVHFMERLGHDPIDVDLVVDLGNTRTVGLLLESPSKLDQNKFNFGQRVRALKVIPWGSAFKSDQKDCEIIDSWLLLHRSIFSAFEPPLTEDFLFDVYEPYKDASGQSAYRLKRYSPQAFVELSPARIGGGKSREGTPAKLANISLKDSKIGLFYLSSPKRYVWDYAPTGEGGDAFWSQLKNVTDEDYRHGFFTPLRGLIRVFMTPDGAEYDWPIDRKLSDDEAIKRFADMDPKYPRSSALAWFALSLIEAAYRQINSRMHLAASGRDGLPRRLRKIMVTYPAGWAYEAKDSFFNQWQRAINLFTLTHFEPDHHGMVDLVSAKKGGSRPVLIRSEMDEAICSQLPVLYADLHGLLSDPKHWCDLYGGDGKVVVMNLDIGGGTSDLAIIEYSLKEQGGRTSLRPRLLFRDGKSIAGDMLVQQVIERVLVPAWLRAGTEGRFTEFPDAIDWIRKFFKNPSHPEFVNLEPEGRLRMVRVIRLLFIPLVNELLKSLTELEGKADAAWNPLNLEQCIKNELINPNTLEELNEIAANVIRHRARNGEQWDQPVFPHQNTLLHCDREEIERCIESVFRRFFYSLATVTGYFKCHLVVVSGKPSELPRLRSLLVETLPVLPQRILHMKNFPAGTWYPFSTFGVGGAGSQSQLSSGRIMDAKTCTVVGAALYLDQQNKTLEGLPLEDNPEETLTGRYFWGVISMTGLPHEFYESPNLLFSRGDYNRIPSSNRSDTEMYFEKDFTLQLNCRIGRQIIRMDEVQPEPIYILRWRPALPPLNQRGSKPRAKVTLRWTVARGKGEYLTLVDVKSVDEEVVIDPQDVKLELNTMLDESFWLDDPKLDISDPFAEVK